MASRIQYLDVTFVEDVMFGALLVPTGTRISLPKDVARGLNSSVLINGIGSSAGALLAGAAAPVTVTGIAGVGDILTAVLSTGWSVTGYQWMRNGSPISGATSSTYLQASADVGTTLTLSVAGLVYTATGVTVPGTPSLGWDDTATWIDTSIWAD